MSHPRLFFAWNKKTRNPVVLERNGIFYYLLKDAYGYLWLWQKIGYSCDSRYKPLPLPVYPLEKVCPMLKQLKD